MAASVRACFALRFSLAVPLQACGGAVARGAVALGGVRPLLQPVRHGSFFNKLTADELWRGVLAETGAGARKGRGKRTKRKMKTDLNRGQNIGEGRAGFLWPGLNAPVFRAGAPQSVSQRDHAQQLELQAELVRSRDEWEKRRRMKVKRGRGWTGNSWGGISLGAPDPGPNGESFEDFDSRVIEVKSVFNMTAKEGRKRSISCLVAVGNGNGAAGFALGKAADRITALRKAKNRAVHYLHYIERYDNHTIYHDIESTFKKTTLHMKKQHQGHGLHCHRAVITLCKLMGIQDLYCKVDGSTNLLNITRALFTGLANQETHQARADRQRLNVVEFQGERGPLPLVVARPEGGARPDAAPLDHAPDTRLHWAQVRVAQGSKRSSWATAKRTIW